jgi:uncharacterized protein
MAAITLSSAYSQDFDTLTNTGTTNVWTNDSTISGWYSNRTTYIGSDGTSNTGALYSFGTTATTERAFGSLASGGADPVVFGARFVNNTSSSLSDLTVNYTGEQWRSSTVAQNSLTFSYQVGATDLTSGTWTNFSNLNYVGAAPVTTNGVLNGNANSSNISSTITGLNIGVNQEIWLRWVDINDAGNDAGLAIDNFSLSATGATAVPEPSDFMGSILAIVAVAIVKRKLSRK